MKILKYSNQLEAQLETWLNKEAFPPDKLRSVRSILKKVQLQGDQALREYTYKFDGARIKKIAVDKKELIEAHKLITPPLRRAFRQARQNIREYYLPSLDQDWTIKRKDGAILGEKITPLASAGIYIPGGNAPLVSTVFMTVVPAQLAGVKRIVLTTPPNKKGRVNPWVLAAADYLGCREIYRVGGAQAIAALAFGTKSIHPVDKIVGPGNIYVTLAKKEVFGYVDIDMLAGPSEIAIISDSSAPPEKLAADLLAQAEHGQGGFSFLISTSSKVLEAVIKSIPPLIHKLSNKKISSKAISHKLKLIKVKSLIEATNLANKIAPEHLEIVTRDPGKTMGRIKNAGAIFLGEFSPVAVGDYIAGPSHVLPTGGSARYFSPLSGNDFTKKSSVIHYDKSTLTKELPLIKTLANLEGLDAHALSALISQGNHEQ